VIIELCGVPGSGKSTVAHGLVTELRRRGHAASLPLEEVSPRRPRGERLRRKLTRAATEVAGHPRASARTVQAVRRSHQPTWRAVAIRSLNWLVLRAAMRRASTTPGFHVFDQGIVQELCSLGFAGDAAAAIDIADPGAALLAPDLIVVVESDLGLADLRLAARPGRESRVEAAGPGRRRELERQAELVEAMLASWTARFGDRVATTVRRIVNGDRPIDSPALVASLHLLHGRTDDYTGDAADLQGVLPETEAQKSDLGLDRRHEPDRGGTPQHPQMTRRTQWS
jgi:hypothetical protein